MPPESWSGNWFAASSSPTRRQHLARARRAARAFGTPWISSPKATLSITRRWASRPKCWNTIETVWRRSSRSSAGVGRHHVVAGDRDLAGARLDQPDQRADERRLARAGQAHDHEHLARLDVERDVAHGDRRSRSSRAARRARARQSGVPMILSAPGPKTFQTPSARTSGSPFGRGWPPLDGLNGSGAVRVAHCGDDISGLVGDRQGWLALNQALKRTVWSSVSVSIG